VRPGGRLLVSITLGLYSLRDVVDYCVIVKTVNMATGCFCNILKIISAQEKSPVKGLGVYSGFLTKSSGAT
jgi:hypothetical protein